MSGLIIFGLVDAVAGDALSLNGLAEEIRLIADGEMAAIVGALPHTPDGQSVSREDRTRRQHQQLLEAVIAETTVLPFKPSMAAPDETAVRRMLVHGRALLAEQLQRFTSRVQMDVMVEWPLNQVFVQIAGDPGIADLRAAAIASDEPDAKFQLGLAVKAALDVRRAEYLSEIAEVLRPAVVEIATTPIADERVVANIALLMERDGLDTLDSALDQLDADYCGKLKFRCAGPLAPSAFATIEVNFPTREAVEQAWQTLQLGARATAAEIKSSYFRIVRELHPASPRANGHSPDMNELAKAHQLLMACAKTSGPELRLYDTALFAISVSHPGEPIPAPTAGDQEAAA